jgi:CheY-like chemotaxis protein
VPAEQLDERRLLTDGDATSQPRITPRDMPVVPAARADVAHRLVLLVDDDADSRLLLSQYVEDFGCQAIAVSSADQGMAAAREFRPDLIVVDLMMPGMNGWEMIKQLRSEPGIADIPTMVVSIVAAENRGNLPTDVDVVDKPVSREAFYLALQRNIDAVRGRVLVVGEDPDAQREIAAHVRDACGMEVLGAADVKQAIAVIGSVRPQQVVVDVGMDALEGVLFIEALRRMPRHAHVPVIVVTADALSDKARERFLYDAQAVITRGPGMLAELQQALAGMPRRQMVDANGRGE